MSVIIFGRGLGRDKKCVLGSGSEVEVKFNMVLNLLDFELILVICEYICIVGLNYVCIIVGCWFKLLLYNVMVYNF